MKTLSVLISILCLHIVFAESQSNSEARRDGDAEPVEEEAAVVTNTNYKLSPIQVKQVLEDLTVSKKKSYDLAYHNIDDRFASIFENLIDTVSTAIKIRSNRSKKPVQLGYVLDRLRMVASGLQKDFAKPNAAFKDRDPTLKKLVKRFTYAMALIMKLRGRALKTFLENHGKLLLEIYKCRDYLSQKMRDSYSVKKLLSRDVSKFEKRSRQLDELMKEAMPTILLEHYGPATEVLTATSEVPTATTEVPTAETPSRNEWDKRDGKGRFGLIAKDWDPGYNGTKSYPYNKKMHVLY